MTSSNQVDMAAPDRDASGATGPAGRGKRLFQPSMTKHKREISESVKDFPDLDPPSDPGQCVQEGDGTFCISKQDSVI